MKIGVLSLQGAFREHLDTLHAIGVDGVRVREPADLEGVSGLILPGGESTTMRQLIERWGLNEPILDLADRGAPIFGTCAGMIFMAKRISATDGRDQPLLGVMDIVVERNAFGRQVDSFITPIKVDGFDDESPPFPAVFIRGPRLIDAGGDARVIAHLSDGTPVAAREGHWLVTSFHPELTDDNRFHEYFLKMVAEEKGE